MKLIYTLVLTFSLFSITIGQQPVSLITHEHDNHRGSVTRLAPRCELTDANGNSVSNSEFYGSPQVLVMYLGHGCLHCSEQLEVIGESASEFKSMGFELMAISTDDSEVLAGAIKDSGTNLPFRFFSDPDMNSFKAFRAYDAFNDKALHATFLIDGKGKICWQSIGEHPFTDTNTLLSEASLIVHQQDQEVDRPKIFLDRSPRIVAYQLGRLSNEKLLLVERDVSDKKYAPVYAAILARDGMSPQFREEAVAALATLNGSDPVAELMKALDATKIETLQGQQTANEIAGMILKQPPGQLAELSSQFSTASEDGNEIQRVVSYAALSVAKQADRAFALAQRDQTKTIDWLKSISLIPVPELRSAARSNVIGMLGNESDSVKVAAIQALQAVPSDQADSFLQLAQLVSVDSLRPAAVRTLLSIQPLFRDSAKSAELARFLVRFAEETPAENRTTDSFLDAMQLVDQLMVSLPVAESKALRSRLNRVTVRVVRIGTVEDEMRYDVPYFAVEAGRPVQVVLDNHDLMAHNLVLTQAGKMKQVAELGGNAGPAKQYLPEDREDILFATDMIQSGEVAKLTFDAPSELGEYPYVCTYPQHWSRMYGVMVVVKDLDAWLKNPVKPKDPIGNTRSYVNRWTVDELKEELAIGVQGRTLDIGKRIFTEATCAQCHQVQGVGGQVGPALDEIFSKHNNDRRAILQEILEPSHRIDEKYVMHKILTLDGATITGIIQTETDEKYELLDNPESEELTTVLKDDIDEMVRSSKSIMPKGLMDNFSKDEIFELFSYLEQSQKK